MSLLATSSFLEPKSRLTVGEEVEDEEDGEE